MNESILRSLQETETESEGAQFMSKLSVFKNKKYSYIYNNFVSAQVLEILFPSLN